MSWSFGGDGDVITVASDAGTADLAALTLCGYIFHPTTQGSTVGTLALKAAGGTTGWRWRMANTQAAYDLRIDYATSDMIRVTADGVYQPGRWEWAVWTWDGSLTAANAHLLTNNTAGAYLATTDGSGARVSDAGNDILIGERVGGGNGYVGTMAHLHLYNRIVPFNQLEQLKVNPGSVTAGLLFYHPMVVGPIDYSGNNRYGTLGPGNSAPTLTPINPPVNGLGATPLPPRGAYAV